MTPSIGTFQFSWMLCSKIQCRSLTLPKTPQLRPSILPSLQFAVSWQIVSYSEAYLVTTRVVMSYPYLIERCTLGLNVKAFEGN